MAMDLLKVAAALALPEAGLPLRILAWAKGAFTYLFAHPMTGAALIAVLFGAVEHHEADKWATVAAQRGAAITAIKAASVEATKHAQAAKDAKDAQNATLAADADQVAVDLRNRYHAAVLQLAANQGRARSADLPGNAEAAQSGNRLGGSAGLPGATLNISQDDALICGDNTARLQAVREWAAAIGE
jgi:hypothetical protein